MGKYSRNSGTSEFRDGPGGRSSSRSAGGYEPLQFQNAGRRGWRTTWHRPVSSHAGRDRQRYSTQRGDPLDARNRYDEFTRFPKEVAMITRRYFLRASAIAAAGLGTAPSWLLRAAAQGESRRKILVAVFQRGAADGLNIVVPFFEKRYYELRPTIAVPAPGKNNGAIDLDGRFALHPSLQLLKPFWDNGQLAIVHASGSPDPN